MATTAVENLKYLRQLFPQQQLHVLKNVAVFYKDDGASLETFVRGAMESIATNRAINFNVFPNQSDADLEDFLRLQRQILQEILPDADEDFVEIIFQENVLTGNLEAIALEAITSQSYPRKVVPKVKKNDFDVQLYCELVPDPIGSFSHANYIMTDTMKVNATDYLTKIFGEDKRAVVWSHVEKEGSLYSAFKKMREDEGGAERQYCVVSSTIQPKTFDEAPDYLQVFEKLLIENEGEILSYLEKKKTEEQELFKHEESAQSLKECPICCNPMIVSSKMLKICDNGHMMCASCTKNYTESLYHQTVVFFPCAFDCKLLISNSVVRSVWDTSRYSRLLEDRISVHVKDAIACPFCRYGNKNLVKPEIQCLNCHKKFCVSCKKTAHFPLECYQKENGLCKVVEEAMTSALVRRCPKCMIPFIKQEACCNKILCGKCQAVSCYICKKIVTGYDHFYGQGIMPSEAPGKCPLYSDINHLHVYNVINAGKEAYEKLKEENPNVELLYNPLDKLPIPGDSDAVPNQF